LNVFGTVKQNRVLGPGLLHSGRGDQAKAKARRLCRLPNPDTSGRLARKLGALHLRIPLTIGPADEPERSRGAARNTETTPFQNSRVANRHQIQHRNLWSVRRHGLLGSVGDEDFITASRARGISATMVLAVHQGAHHALPGAPMRRVLADGSTPLRGRSGRADDGEDKTPGSLHEPWSRLPVLFGMQLGPVGARSRGDKSR